MIVVTGTGRCGTGYVAKLLSSAGVECEHEGLFNRDANWEDVDVGQMDFNNSSWLLAPFLERLQEDTKIVHLVRHPKPTIDSFRRIGFFNPRVWRYHWPYSRFVKDHLPEAFDYTSTRMRAAHFYAKWNRMIEEKAPGAILHRVEDGGEALLDKLGIEHDGELFDDTMYNHRDGPVHSDVDLGALWEPCKGWIEEMMVDYGYEPIEVEKG